jgi:hypothetical protein
MGPMTDWKFGDVVKRDMSQPINVNDEETRAMVIGPGEDTKHLLVIGLVDTTKAYRLGHIEQIMVEWWVRDD